MAAHSCAPTASARRRTARSTSARVAPVQECGTARSNRWKGRFYGRVFTYQPGTGELRTVVKDVGFANGNAIDPTGQFLVIADTIRYRILRLWLAGTKAGEVDEFASNLPGFPHNIHYDDAGLLWVGSWMDPAPHHHHLTGSPCQREYTSYQL